MGFWTKMPVYHGTVSDLDAFTFGRGGTVSGSLVGTLGVSVALDREVAEEFAKKSAQGGSRTGPKASGRKAKSQPDGVVLNLLHRAEKPALIDLTGREKDLEIAATVQDAWDDDYDAIMRGNCTTPGGLLKGKSLS
jgi:hypothetical protein